MKPLIQTYGVYKHRNTVAVLVDKFVSLFELIALRSETYVSYFILFIQRFFFAQQRIKRKPAVYIVSLSLEISQYNACFDCIDV